MEDEIQVEETEADGKSIEDGVMGVSTAITIGTSFINLFGYTWSAVTIAENLSFQSYDTSSYRINMEVVTYAKIYRYQEEFDVGGDMIMVKTMGVDPQPSHFETLSRLSYEETEILYCLYGKKEVISDIQTLEDYIKMEVNEAD